MDTPSTSGEQRKRKRNIISASEIEHMIDCSDADISSDEFSEDEYIPNRISSDSEKSEDEEGANETGEALKGTDVLWNNGPIIFKAFPFNETPGLDATLQALNDPYKMFRSLFTDELLELVVVETNRLAAQKNLAGSGGRKGVKWHDVTKSEILLFFAIVFLMGIIRLPTLQHYWRTDFMFKHPFFGHVMSRDRFKQILNSIHFTDNESADKNYITWKCKPIIDGFNERMNEIHVPSKQMSIDESMMLFRGRIRFRQYIKNKKHKYGLKYYMLCERNGLTQKLLLFAGKGDLQGPDGHTAAVVNELMDNYKNRGYSLYMDNFYNSVSLSKKLLEVSTHSTGTFGRNRKGNSEEVVKKKLKKGESFWQQKQGIVQLKWKDKNDVLVMSTEHQPDMKLTTNARGIERTKPDIVVQYNKYMSGVDMSDQQIAYYDILRKTVKWYRKVCFHVFQIMLVNAHILHNRYTACKISLVKFQELVVRGLLQEGKYDIPREIAEPAPAGHFPALFKPKETAKETRKGSRHRCRQCRLNNKKSLTVYFCAGCPTHPPLCVLCFSQFHHE